MNEAIEEIVELTSPITIQCENGKKIDNNFFKNIMNERGITMQFVDIGDHKMSGIVDRFANPLREKKHK